MSTGKEIVTEWWRTRFGEIPTESDHRDLAARIDAALGAERARLAECEAELDEARRFISERRDLAWTERDAAVASIASLRQENARGRALLRRWLDPADMDERTERETRAFLDAPGAGSTHTQEATHVAPDHAPEGEGGVDRDGGADGDSVRGGRDRVAAAVEAGSTLPEVEPGAPMCPDENCGHPEAWHPENACCAEDCDCGREPVLAPAAPPPVAGYWPGVGPYPCADHQGGAYAVQCVPCTEKWIEGNSARFTAAQAERSKLQAFKDYVHRRLDEAGVPAYPDGPHSKEGCRVGDRLDLVFEHVSFKEAALTAARAEAASMRAHMAQRDEDHLLEVALTNEAHEQRDAAQAHAARLEGALGEIVGMRVDGKPDPSGRSTITYRIGGTYGLQTAIDIARAALAVPNARGDTKEGT